MGKARRTAALLLAASLAACGGEPGAAPAEGAAAVVRIGHFPNVTHAHGLVAHALTRKGKGWFEERLGPGVKVEWYGTYNAGPSAMEAILIGALDLVYVGPNPALNTHVRSRGREIRVLSGATRGGSALVVREGSGIREAKDFRGRRVATPQIGNTQDVACRAWLLDHGFEVRMTGGDVTVIPMNNADHLTLFKSGDLDASWTVEPWVSRLEMEGGGRVLLEEKDAMTTVFASSAKFLAEKPDLARRALTAHRDLTKWIAANPAEAKALVRGEIQELTKREVPADLLDRCWERMRFDDAVSRADFDAFVKAAGKAGLLAESHDLSRLVEDLK